MITNDYGFESANNFAVMSYSFHGLLSVGAMDIFGYMETVRYRYNLQTADIWNGFLKSYDDAYLKLVKQNLDERGLTVVNLCCDYCCAWDNNPDIREKNEKVAWDCLRAAEILGAKTIRMDAGPHDDVFSDEQLEIITKKYRAYCKRANELGAKLGPENHWGASRNPVELRKLIDAVAMDNFGVLLHLNGWNSGDVDENDRAFIRDAFHMHIPFEQCVMAERIIPPLMEIGYSGCWTVESHKGFNEYNNVAFQLAQIKRVVAPLLYSNKHIQTIPE
jgi:sugar phosphate isomerase/epimerase